MDDSHLNSTKRPLPLMRGRSDESHRSNNSSHKRSDDDSDILDETNNNNRRKDTTIPGRGKSPLSADAVHSGGEESTTKRNSEQHHEDGRSSGPSPSPKTTTLRKMPHLGSLFSVTAGTTTASTATAGAAAASSNETSLLHSSPSPDLVTMDRKHFLSQNVKYLSEFQVDEDADGNLILPSPSEVFEKITKNEDETHQMKIARHKESLQFKHKEQHDEVAFEDDRRLLHSAMRMSALNEQERISRSESVRPIIEEEPEAGAAVDTNNNGELITAGKEEDQVLEQMNPLDLEKTPEQSPNAGEREKSEHHASGKEQKPPVEAEKPSALTFLQLSPRMKKKYLEEFGPFQQRQRIVSLRQRWEVEGTMLNSVRAAVLFKKPMKPEGKFRSKWDAVIAVGVIYTLIVVPVDIAFVEYSRALLIIDIMVDVMFMLDFFFNFVTAYRGEDDFLVMDFKKIRRRYLTTWALTDFIAALPITIILLAVEQNNGFNQTLQSLKLVKVLRLLRIRHLFRFLETLDLNTSFQFVIFLTMYYLFIHWTGLIFWQIAVIEGLDNSWVASQHNIRNLSSQAVQVQYAVSIYWATQTMATLGYGDVPPVTQAERIYATFMIITGALMYGLIISVVGYLLRVRFQKETLYAAKLNQVTNYSKLNHLPKAIRLKLVQYYEYLWMTRRVADTNASIMGELPFELKAEVAEAIQYRMINNSRILSKCTTIGFVHILSSKLGESKICVPGDILFFEDEPISEVFFIKRGMVHLISHLDLDDELLVSKRRGSQHCGDMGLFTRSNKGAIEVRDDQSEAGDSVRKDDRAKRHLVSGIVMTFSEIHPIDLVEFEAVLGQFPKERFLFKQVGIAREIAMLNLLQNFAEIASGTSRAPKTPRVMKQSSFQLLNENMATTIKQTLETVFSPMKSKTISQNELIKQWTMTWEVAVSPETDDTIVEKVISLCDQEEIPIGRPSALRHAHAATSDDGNATTEEEEEEEDGGNTSEEEEGDYENVDRQLIGVLRNVADRLEQQSEMNERRKQKTSPSQGILSRSLLRAQSFSSPASPSANNNPTGLLSGGGSLRAFIKVKSDLNKEGET